MKNLYTTIRIRAGQPHAKENPVMNESSVHKTEDSFSNQDDITNPGGDTEKLLEETTIIIDWEKIPPDKLVNSPPQPEP